MACNSPHHARPCANARPSAIRTPCGNREPCGTPGPPVPSPDTPPLPTLPAPAVSPTSCRSFGPAKVTAPRVGAGGSGGAPSHRPGPPPERAFTTPTLSAPARFRPPPLSGTASSAACSVSLGARLLPKRGARDAREARARPSAAATCTHNPAHRVGNAGQEHDGTSRGGLAEAEHSLRKANGHSA